MNKKEKTTPSMLTEKTILLINKGVASRDKIIVLACLDVERAMPGVSRDVVRAEIKAVDAEFSVNNDSLQAILNAIRNNIKTQKQLLKICIDARLKGNSAKRKSSGKKTGKTTGKSKSSGKKDTVKDTVKDSGHQDSILELPPPKDYEDMRELLVDYNHLRRWLEAAEKKLREENLLK